MKKGREFSDVCVCAKVTRGKENKKAKETTKFLFFNGSPDVFFFMATLFQMVYRQTG